jgi:hypothetical protein
MGDQEQKQQQISPEPTEEDKKKENELSEEELTKATGGNAFEPPDPCIKKG